MYLKRMIRTTLLACGATILLGVAGPQSCHVVPPDASGYQVLATELSADWWQWVASIPLDVNPMIDEDGAFQDQGQSGWVWFLGSTFGDPTAPPYERYVTVPHGKSIFVPIVPVVFWAPEDGETEEDLRALANEAVDGVTMLECTIDGVPVQNLFDHRTESDGFTLPDTLLVDFGLPAGDRLAVADGYWILMNPLRKGEHELHFSMEITEGPFAGSSHDVTYYLTIGDQECSSNPKAQTHGTD